MWTHRQVKPFTRFLPVLSLSTTEQHAILSLTFCVQLGKLYTSPLFCATCFPSLGDSPQPPFGTTNLLPDLSERLLPMTVEFWRILMKTPSQNFLLVIALTPFSRWIHKSANILSSTSLVVQGLLLLNHWMIFESTTSFNSSPLLVWRHSIRTLLSKSRFSLS